MINVFNPMGADPCVSDLILCISPFELIDLQTNDVRTYDRFIGEMFIMRATIMWTVNDFPTYGMLLGWSIKAYMACPTCGEGTSSYWNAGKVYMSHRRWLPWDHN